MTLSRIHFLAALTVCSALILQEIEYLPHAYLETSPAFLSYVIIVFNALAKWSTFSCVIVSVFAAFWSITRNIDADIIGGFAFFSVGLISAIIQEFTWFTAHLLDLYEAHITERELSSIHSPKNGKQYYVAYMIPSVGIMIVAIYYMVHIASFPVSSRPAAADVL